MPPVEKTSTKIIAGVAITVIGAAICWFGSKYLVTPFEWILAVIASVWRWIFTTHAVYGWLILLLPIPVIMAGFSIFNRLSKSTPSEDEFTGLKFNGIQWRWRIRSDGAIFDVSSFCPQPGCDMQIIPTHVGYAAYHNDKYEYRCDRCGYKIEIEGHQEDTQNRVLMEAQRLLRNGEWKNHVNS